MNNIFLIGFMGSGKTTIANRLNRKYGVDVIDMDKTIENNEGMKISEIFENKGEDYFRRLETELILELKKKHNTVVSCGGGAALKPENVEEMKSSGKIIMLEASPETILERVKNNHSRPLLEGNKNIEYIAELMSKRVDKYMAAADMVINVDNKGIEDICKEIMDK